MRDLLIDAFNEWLQISDFELTKIKYIVRMLHNASLLYVIDEMAAGFKEKNEEEAWKRPISSWPSPLLVFTLSFSLFSSPLLTT